MDPSRPKEAPPTVVGKPVIKLEDNNTRVVVEIKVKAVTKPTADWTFANKPIKSGGRYFLDVAHENGHYIIIMEIENVSPLHHECMLMF